MDDFDSGWDETPSSLDSENMNNYEVNDTISGYQPSEIRQQMLEMRDDPAMSYHTTNITNGLTSENKDNGSSSSIDYSSLSSEIFLATRLLHDETLDTTALSTLTEQETSPYNDAHNFASYLESGGNQQDAIDSIGLSSQHEVLDSDFLYNSFERQILNYDEDNSNKSWSESLPPTAIMLAPVRNISREPLGEKPKGERKKRMIKIKAIRKKPTSMINNNYRVENNVTFKSDTSQAIGTVTFGELSGNRIESSPRETNSGVTTVIEEDNNRLKKEVAVRQCGATGLPSTFIVPVPPPPASPLSRNSSNAKVKDTRKIPSYLTKFKLRDEKYPHIFACKNCFGIFTTLDAAVFHQCLKKRRGRRPKVLENCVIP